MSAVQVIAEQAARGEYQTGPIGIAAVGRAEDGVEDACTSGAIEGVSDLIHADCLDADYPGE
jgi:hypothetical protein